MKKFKLILVFSFLIISIQSLAFFGGNENTLEKIQKEKKLVIGLDDTFAPMGFRDSSGNIIGFDIDLANEVGKKLGVNVVFKPVEWDGIIFELKSKKIDMIWSGMTITEDRRKKISFTNPYFESNQIIIVKSGSNIKTLDDLKGRIVGVQLGSTAYFSLEESSVFNSLKDVRKYASNVDALLDLEAGRVDAVVIDSMVGNYYTTTKEAKEGKDIFTSLDIIFASEEMGVGIRQQDKELLDKMNSILNELKADGTYDRIYKKWFGSDS